MGKIKSLCYNINAYDASELIESVLNEIRDQLDCVNAIWQKKSYCGNLMDEEDLNELKRLKSIGLIDNLIEFPTNFAKPCREQETDKRNMGIEWARSHGYSHVMSVDADEFYDKDQFRLAKEIINKKGYSITYWSYVNYYRDFDHYLVYPFKPYVPGICSTYFNYTFNGPAPGPTDPTRRILNPMNLGTYLFKDEEIRMGHAAWIRKDIYKKLTNWSAKDYFAPELINKAVERLNNWKEGDNAIMLFNTPDNEVKVKKLDKRIHNFDVPWLTNK
ncbi:hypothetical protein M0Q50_09115 [bacterium]|jgi:hypothetical protein|nr:hypothetical protein [bacterium]